MRLHDNCDLLYLRTFHSAFYIFFQAVCGKYVLSALAVYVEHVLTTHVNADDVSKHNYMYTSIYVDEFSTALLLLHSATNALLFSIGITHIDQQHQQQHRNSKIENVRFEKLLL